MPKDKMSKSKSLSITLEMWEEMRLTGCLRKRDLECYTTEFVNDCALCQYVEDNFGEVGEKGGCSNCPVQWVKDANGDYFPCQEEDSPYDKWCNCAKFGKNLYAGEMVEKIKEAIDAQKE